MTNFLLGDGMRFGRYLLAFIFSLSCITFSWAQGAPAPAANPKTVVIHAGHLLDVKTGKTLSNQTIVIQGDKIASVKATSGDELLPTGATVVRTPQCCRD
jgi:hypothetical protein